MGDLLLVVGGANDVGAAALICSELTAGRVKKDRFFLIGYCGGDLAFLFIPGQFQRGYDPRELLVIHRRYTWIVLELGGDPIHLVATKFWANTVLIWAPRMALPIRRFLHVITIRNTGSFELEYFAQTLDRMVGSGIVHEP